MPAVEGRTESDPMHERAPAPDLSKARRVHIVGVAGAGMSAIATVLAQMGHRVTGSDEAGGPVMNRLEKLGIQVHVGHVPDVAAAADFVAVSSAIPDDDPEVLEARRRGLSVWSRSAVLAAICRQRRTAAVSGSHGKTTTSSMLAVILLEAGWHPSMVIGGDIAGVGQGAAWDSAGEWMVVEADESDGTFIQLEAEAVAVTSVGSDHLDHYGTRDELDRAFTRFIADAPGPAVVCVDDAGAQSVIRSVGPAAERRLVTYGTSPNAAVRVDGVELFGDRARFYLEERGVRRGPVKLAVPGLHNVLNATAALALAASIGVSWDEAVEAISAYQGVGRRFETRGTVAGVTFVDDYAHNPEKVAAALATARGGSWSRVVAVFQPHRYSRTEALWREFGPSLSAADVLIVTGIYSAGERPRPGISGQLIAQAVRDARPGADVRYAETLDEAEQILREELRTGDLCITIGAGDITGLAARFLRGGDAGDG